MTDHLRLINTEEESPFPRQLLQTNTSTDILRSIELARMNAPMLTMIAGVPGSGKSRTVLRYTQEDPDNVILHEVVASECNIWDLAINLMARLDIGAPNSRRMVEARHKIAEAIGPERLLIIDEAQYLTKRNPRGPDDHQAFEWLRQMSEKGFFSIVFCRDLSLVDNVHEVPQLYRRIVRPVIVRQVPAEDVALLAAQHGVHHPDMRNMLVRVAQRHGGLADVENVIKHAKLFAGSQTCGPKELSAAIYDLKLSSKGVLT